MGTHAGTFRALLGFLYPSYKTINAVLTDEMDDDLIWLKYWAVMSLFSMLELVVDPLVDFFPGYLLAKCVFLLWCMAPIDENGSNLIFSQVVMLNTFVE